MTNHKGPLNGFRVELDAMEPPSLHVQTVIADFRYVVERLSDFYTPDETRLWLHASHPLLARERPVDLIHAGRTEEILALVDRMEAGAYL
jgi:uncharacterized protein (DUF2384 family)